MVRSTRKACFAWFFDALTVVLDWCCNEAAMSGGGGRLSAKGATRPALLVQNRKRDRKGIESIGKVASGKARKTRKRAISHANALAGLHPMDSEAIES
jgi:hypothetical protein